MRSDTAILIAHYYYCCHFFIQPMGIQGGVACVKIQAGDSSPLVCMSRDEAIKSGGCRCCVYSNSSRAHRKQGDYEKTQRLHSTTWFLTRKEAGSYKGLALPTAAPAQSSRTRVQPYRQLKDRDADYTFFFFFRKEEGNIS